MKHSNASFVILFSISMGMCAITHPAFAEVLHSTSTPISENASETSNHSITITKAHALPSLGLRRPSVAFMHIQNTTTQKITLLKASADVWCDHIEIHEHMQNGDIMQMQKVSTLPIPAMQTVQLRSGGLHLMLMGLKKPLRAGDALDITLDFDDNTSQKINVVVRTR